MVNRPALGAIPGKDHEQIIKDAYMAIKPTGFDRVVPTMCGTCSVEWAIRMAMMNY